MKLENEDFPTVDEILQAVRKCVDTEFGEFWPEDHWLDFGHDWTVNVWDDEGQRKVTVYRDYLEDGLRTTDCSIGINLI